MAVFFHIDITSIFNKSGPIIEGICFNIYAPFEYVLIGINTQYAIAYNILNLCSFAVVVLAGGKLINIQIGKEQKGYFIARFLFILAAFLINSSILIP